MGSGGPGALRALPLAVALRLIDTTGVLLLTTSGQRWAGGAGVSLVELGRDLFFCLGCPIVRWGLVPGKEHAKPTQAFPEAAVRMFFPGARELRKCPRLCRRGEVGAASLVVRVLLRCPRGEAKQRTACTGPCRHPGTSGPKRGFVSTSVHGIHQGNPHPFPSGVTLTLCHPDLALCCFIVVCSGRHRAAAGSMGQGPGPFGCLWRCFSQSCNNPVLTGPHWQHCRWDVSSCCAHRHFPLRLRPSCLGQTRLRCRLSSQP